MDVRKDQDIDEIEDVKLQKACIWGERKFCRMVVRIGILLRGCFGQAPANITNEAIDEALEARNEVIKQNMQRVPGTPAHHLSFRSRKELRHTITIRAQNFAQMPWSRFYVSYLHTSEIQLSCKRHKPLDHDDERPLWPLHFETKRKNNKWPVPHKVSSDCKLTFTRRTNEWTLAWVHERRKQHRDTQADGSIHAVSIDPGVRTPFTWYSPTKGTGKIGNRDIGRVVRLCQYMDDLISRMDRLKASSSKRKQRKAKRLAAAVARMRRDIIRLQNEIHRKAIAFFVREFDAIVIPPFEVSNMVSRKTRKITRRTVRNMLGWAHFRFRERLTSKAEEAGVRIIIQNEAYTSKTCSWCGNMQAIGGSETYNCRGCGVRMDRDENGARGIFLRALLDGALVLS
jgi:IS605 OrfB family transposase